MASEVASHIQTIALTQGIFKDIPSALYVITSQKGMAKLMMILLKVPNN